MKIYILCPSLTHGGAQRVAANLSNAFVRNGHQVTLFTDLSQPVTYPIEKAVQLFPLWENARHHTRWITAIRSVREKMRREHPDIVIGMMHLCSLAGRLAALALPVIPILTIHHAVGHQEVPYSLATRLADRWMPPLFPCVTVLTHADRHSYRHKAHIHVMPNPLTFPPAEDIPRKEKIILAAGRLSAVYIKGWDLLIRAWTMVDRMFPDWQLVIAGDGNEADIRILRQLMADGGVEHHTLLAGYQRDMLPWYWRAAIFISSSRSEGQPMVLLEAMSQGCACIATENDGRTKETITNEQEGIICQADACSLAQALTRLLRNNPLRATLQQGALRRSCHYRQELIAAQWQRLFHSLKNNNR
mgnify:FL=1